jgi:hypothetical protein
MEDLSWFAPRFMSGLGSGRSLDQAKRRSVSLLSIVCNTLELLQVNVSVNGHPIPFSMKIGEAGEAFFVFETDSDVPDELITSPLLQPTQPDELSEPDIPTREVDTSPHPDNDKVPEPEFLDLDAIPSPSSSAFRSSSSPSHVEPAPAQLPPSTPRTPTLDSYIPLATPSSLLLRTGPQSNPPQDTFNQLLKHLNDDKPVIDITYANGKCDLVLA